MRNVLLTEFFGCSDWGKLDKDRESKPSRFDTWPAFFAKEVKKASESDSSEQRPRKRDTKAAKKVTAPPATNSVSLDSDLIERKRKRIEESPSVAIEVPQLNIRIFEILSFNRLIESASKSGDDMVEWMDEEKAAYHRDFFEAVDQGLTSVETDG